MDSFETENYIPPTEAQIWDYMKPKCPVKIGDRIYRKHANMTLPDRLEVIDIKPDLKTGGYYFIKARYMYHAIGQTERTFSDIIFKDDSWVIERKGIDF